MPAVFTDTEERKSFCSSYTIPAVNRDQNGVGIESQVFSLNSVVAAETDTTPILNCFRYELAPHGGNVELMSVGRNDNFERTKEDWPKAVGFYSCNF